jgi:hypothetical protein
MKKPEHPHRDVDADLRLLAVAVLAGMKGVFPGDLYDPISYTDRLGDAVGLEVPLSDDDHEYLWELMEHLPVFLLHTLREAWS